MSSLSKFPLCGSSLYLSLSLSPQVSLHTGNDLYGNQRDIVSRTFLKPLSLATHRRLDEVRAMEVFSDYIINIEKILNKSYDYCNYAKILQNTKMGYSYILLI